MKLYSKFNCGDKAWVIQSDPEGHRAVELTIGQVRIKVTDSKGSPGTIFDNYKPQSGREESYMCVETGINSGSVYTLDEHIFATRNKAENAILAFKKKKMVA